MATPNNSDLVQLLSRYFPQSMLTLREHALRANTLEAQEALRPLPLPVLHAKKAARSRRDTLPFVQFEPLVFLADNGASDAPTPSFLLEDLPLEEQSFEEFMIERHPASPGPPEEGLAMADLSRSASRGSLLCEQCWDAMTDLVIPASETATGLEEACCEACQELRERSA